MTVRVSATVVLPEAFEPVTVYAARVASTVGVPERTPVVPFSERPAGSAGDTE